MSGLPNRNLGKGGVCPQTDHPGGKSPARRTLLKVGSLGILSGLTLPRLIRARATSAEGARKTSVIYLELAGGPSQFETYDPKPDAPREYRGMFGSIPTTLAGIRFCDLMPRQARILDKLAIVRSIRHRHNSHDPSSHLVQSGYYKVGPKGGPNQFPCIGSTISKLRGPNAHGLPAYAAIPKVMRNGRAAFLGNSYDPFEVGNDPNAPDFNVKNLVLEDGLTIPRLQGRRELLTSLDQARRFVDTSGVGESIDRFTAEALELVTGERARKAFDLSREDDRLRDLYGRHPFGQGMLLARRLVEAGVTIATVRIPGWDDHSNIEPAMNAKGPPYDQAITALISDLHLRGLDRDVLVVAIGEFGRTPRINKKAGRDHWGPLMSVLFAGGGVRGGNIIGASNANGEVPIETEYHPNNVLATIYRHLGVDPASTITDFSGRPHHLLDRHEVIRELY